MEDYAANRPPVEDHVNHIDRLVSESEIRNLVARLGHLADDGDLAEYMSLLTEDATWGHAGAGDTLRGHEELLAGAQQRRRDGIQGPGTGTLHLNTTLWVAIDAPDQARAESYFLYLRTHGTDRPEIVRTGRYVDTLRRTERGWRLASRTIVNEVN
jgi:ketosteroid isomerase-like protein